MFPLQFSHSKGGLGGLARPGLIARLIAPEIFESIWRQFGIANRVLDILMSKVELQGTGVLSVISQFESTGMTKHARMHREGYGRNDTASSEQLTDVAGGHGPAALRKEDIR